MYLESQILNPLPYRAVKNNRKRTIARIKAQEVSRIQSIPIHEIENGNLIFKGYKYIHHK